MSQPLSKPKPKKSAYPESPHKFNEVILAWQKNPGKPKLVFCAHAGKNVAWDWNFTLSYEVVLDGWRYIVQAHVHEYLDDRGQVPGNTFVPGFENQTVKAPGFVLADAPEFDESIHSHDWSSDGDYRSALYNQKTGYRYPTKL
jgi:hypothetical protein